jgi:hypothetical protein
MGNYAVRNNKLLQAWQMRAAVLMFQGMSDEEIAKELFRPGNDKKKLQNGKSKLQSLRRKPAFLEYYRSIVTEWSVHNVGRALLKIADQINDPNSWLANKAANDILTQSKRMIIGDEENTVTVKIEGMPELGEPEKS